MIKVVTEEMHGSDRVPDLNTDCEVRENGARSGVAGQEKAEHAEKERTIPSDFVSKAGSESRQELRAREPKAIQKVWQTTISTALFG
jgi:hypothetical protein